MFPLFELLIAALALAAVGWAIHDRIALTRIRALHESAVTMAEGATSRADEFEMRFEDAQDTINDLNQQRAALEARGEQIQANFEAQKQAMRDEFKSLSAQILESREKAFEARSSESLGTLLEPLKTQIKSFSERTEQINKDNTTHHATLQNELKQLKELNRKITDEASNLTQALKGDSKLQGNWGEMQVELILDRAGLTKGLEYEREVSITEGEQRYRPDVIVHLPEGKHLVVDSKVSLTAWMDVVNAGEDPIRAAAMVRHLDSIKKHIDGLSKKDYAKLNGLQTPDFVLMFMPIEPAFQAAFQAQPDLYQYAFERNIIIVVPSTLLGMLRTVANIWAQQKRGESARQLAEEATKLHDKLRIFSERFEELGKLIDRTQSQFDKTRTSITGRGALVRTIQSFEEKGVQFKKELPASLLDAVDGPADAEPATGEPT